MKNAENNQLAEAIDCITIANHLKQCRKDRKGKCQALSAIFNDVCKAVKKEKNSPKDLIDDIRYLINDYLENAVQEQIIIL